MPTFKTISTLFTAACLTMLTAPVFASGARDASDVPVLKIENFIGTVKIVTGDVDKIRVTDADGANVSQTSRGLTLDDDRNIRDYNCRYKTDTAYIGKGKWGWKLGGKGY